MDNNTNNNLTNPSPTPSSPTPQSTSNINQPTPPPVQQPPQPDFDQLIDQMSNEQLLDIFVTQMMEEKGLKSQIDQNSFEKTKQEMIVRLNYDINRAVLSQLPDDKLELVEKELDSENGNFSRIDQILEESQVDISGITSRVMQEFREKYLGNRQEA